MRALQILCFILAIPFLAALGHDAYITYQDQNYDQPMKFSQVGWLLQTYAPDSLGITKDSVEPTTWDTVITPVLKMRTVILTGVPFLGTLALILLLKGLEIVGAKGLMTRSIPAKTTKRQFVGKSGESKTAFKYKRK